MPQRGAPEALTEVIAGRVDFYFAPLINAPRLKDGKLQALAVSGSQRRIGLAGCADDGGGWLPQLRIQFLGRCVHAVQGSRRHPREAA